MGNTWEASLERSAYNRVVMRRRHQEYLNMQRWRAATPEERAAWRARIQAERDARERAMQAARAAAEKARWDTMTEEEQFDATLNTILGPARTVAPAVGNLLDSYDQRITQLARDDMIPTQAARLRMMQEAREAHMRQLEEMQRTVQGSLKVAEMETEFSSQPQYEQKELTSNWAVAKDDVLRALSYHQSRDHSSAVPGGRHMAAESREIIKNLAASGGPEMAAAIRKFAPTVIPPTMPADERAALLGAWNAALEEGAPPSRLHKHARQRLEDVKFGGRNLAATFEQAREHIAGRSRYSPGVLLGYGRGEAHDRRKRG